MATYLDGQSRTFQEFLLLPNLTKKTDRPDAVDLSTPLDRFGPGRNPRIRLRLPMTSAVMQSVSGPELAIALARAGGLSFIFHSQPIERQVEMIRRVKSFKAGFVVSDSNLQPEATIAEGIDLAQRTGHSTIAVTQNGTPDGPFMGLLTRQDIPIKRDRHGDAVRKWMTPVGDMVTARHDVSLTEAQEQIFASRQKCLPVLDGDGRLVHLVFRRDFEAQEQFPFEMTDPEHRLLVGAGINTHDYRERVPALLDAGADVLCIDASDGFSEWQQDAFTFIRKEYGPDVIVGGGNVVEEEGFRYLADAGADFIKVGIGGGSICITREQKGLGCGQASAVMAVAAARDRYYRETGTYIPLCSDGGIQHDYHITLALAMGADFVMLGRYFARFDESPGRKLRIGTRYVKEYWAEGSERARNWARYDMGGERRLQFEEGVDGYVPYAGDLQSNVARTRAKLVSTMCNCGSITIPAFQDSARIINVSQQSFLESTYSIERKDSEDMRFA
ncbi:MAG: IMP dehydrogenase [Alphaproteobacteria bacterium]